MIKTLNKKERNMKKRAMLSTFTSLALAGVMCVGFAACGDNGDYGNAKAAQEITGEEVTKAVWDAAVQCVETKGKFIEVYDDFEVVVTSESVDTQDFGTGSVIINKNSITTYNSVDYNSRSLLQSKTKTKIKGTLPDIYKLAFKSGTETKEYEYFVIWSEPPAVVDKGVDGYRNIKINDSNRNSYPSGYDVIKNLIEWRLEMLNFDAFQYSQEHGGYVKKGASTDEELAVIKFKDGKLKAFYFETNYENTSELYTTNSVASYVINYGGQRVTVPDVA